MTARLPLVLLGAATLVAASCGTDRPSEHFRLPVTESTGGGMSSASGGATSTSGGSGNFGGAGPDGGSPSVGGSGQATTGGSGHATGGNGAGGSPAGGAGSTGGGSNGSGGTGAAGSGGAAPDYDCDAPSGSAAAFTRAALRQDAAACVEYYYCRFEGASTALASSIEDFQADPSGEHSTAARAAWLEALREWSVLEAMQFGPAASATPTAGKDIYQGHGVRDLVYSWPQISRCRVDEQVALQKYLTLGVDQALISARGLIGIETLLYYQGLDTECGTNTTTYDVWSTLDEPTIGQRRRAYALALSENILQQARGLVDSWHPDGDNFRDTFVSASGYPDEQEAMNVLGWALLYIEREVKDWKLGVPAGYTVGAPVSGPEALYAGEQTALLLPNLEGFRRIFQGCGPEYAGIGFDDWLIDAGHADLSTDILLATDGAQQALQQLPRFPEATVPQIQTAYAAVKALTDLLKADLFGTGSPINLKLPASLEGDTD